MKTVDIESVLKMPSKNLIDIRDRTIYQIGHIEGAINIPMAELLRDPEHYLKEGETYYLYCEFGHKSRRVCDVLYRLGYHVVNIKDGYYSYEQLR